MLSTLFKIGPITIHSYGLMIAIGFLLAMFLAQRDASKAGIDSNIVGNLAFFGLAFGILGTRLLHIAMFPQGYSWTDPIGWIAIWRGGLVFQGALPGAVLAIWAGCRYYKIPFWKTADLGMPYLPLAHAFGRIGCFMNGCCYGCRTDLPWGIRFPRVPWDFSQPATGSPAYLDHCNRFSGLSMTHDHWSYPVHPTQLYGFVGLLTLCFILLYVRKHYMLYDGMTMPVYLVLYSIGRFFVEAIRGDHNPTIGILSEQQIFCIVTVALGVVLFFILKRFNTPKVATPQRSSR